MKLEFSPTGLRKKAEISSFIKICPVRVELFHADRRTDMTKLIVVLAILQTRLKNKQADKLKKVQIYTALIKPALYTHTKKREGETVSSVARLGQAQHASCS
jgi:hypothetical protein